MNTNSHIQCYIRGLDHRAIERKNTNQVAIQNIKVTVMRKDTQLPNCINHIQTHFNTTFSMVFIGLRKSRNAIVTVTEDFDSHTTIFLFRKEKRDC